MGDIYYNEINYFDPIAGMKQTAAEEMVNNDGGVTLNAFNITEAKESEDYEMGDDIENIMMGDILKMQNGELRYAKIAEVAHTLVAPTMIIADMNKVNDACKNILDSHEAVIVDDEGNIVDTPTEKLYDRMLEENFTKCYFVKTKEADIMKYQPTPVRQEEDCSKKMTIYKYAVYGKI